MTPEERAEFDALKEQFRLAQQMIVRLHLTLSQITQGKEMRQTVKPGMEGAVVDVPVPADAPTYRFVPVSDRQSKIIGNDGSAFRIHNNGN